jgi:hypothetical protein
MTSRHRNTGRALALFALLATACVSKQEARTARQSQYDADFAVVYTAAVESVRQLYPTFDDNAATGMIKTAWHQVKFSDPGADDPKSNQVADRAAGAGVNSPTGAGALGGNPSLARRLYFIRFNVTSSPVAGRGGSGSPGWPPSFAPAMRCRPSCKRRRRPALAERPHRRAGDRDPPQAQGLRARRCPTRRPRSWPRPSRSRSTATSRPAPDRGRGRDRARAATSATTRPCAARSPTTSCGAAARRPAPTLALAMWQADPTILAALDAAIRAGCGGGTDAVVCPAAATPASRRSPGAAGRGLEAHRVRRGLSGVAARVTRAAVRRRPRPPPRGCARWRPRSGGRRTGTRASSRPGLASAGCP